MLLIDIGNSWLKSAHFRDEVLHPISPLEISHFKSDRTVCWTLPDRKMLSPEKILVSSVATLDTRIFSGDNIFLSGKVQQTVRSLLK